MERFAFGILVGWAVLPHHYARKRCLESEPVCPGLYWIKANWKLPTVELVRHELQVVDKAAGVIELLVCFLQLQQLRHAFSERVCRHFGMT